MAGPTEAQNHSRYYLTTTTWSDVEITAASTIEDLKTATPQIVYTDTTDPRFAANWWAPEVWRVEDRWWYVQEVIVPGFKALDFT